MIEELSTPQLLQRLSEQTKTLVQQEVRLAQLELTAKAKRAGVGAGALGAATVLGYFAVLVLLAAAVLGLDTAFSPWLSALIVAGGLLLLAAVLALVGKALLSRAMPPAPKAAIESTKADVAALKQAVSR